MQFLVVLILTNVKTTIALALESGEQTSSNLKFKKKSQSNDVKIS
jgi:hypothetical protein